MKHDSFRGYGFGLTFLLFGMLLQIFAAVFLNRNLTSQSADFNLHTQNMSALNSATFSDVLAKIDNVLYVLGCAWIIIQAAANTYTRVRREILEVKAQ